MAMKMELFVPPAFNPKPLDLDGLSKLVDRNLKYASKGRHAIGHILKSLNLKNNVVLLSPYICNTVIDKIEQMGGQIEYYDISAKDLNPSPDSVEKRIDETGASIVVAPSLYGNPADMVKIEAICRKKDTFLIDDAAQSFGARMDGRLIGTFGNGGIWAFSPGKATAGHMGAFFWSQNEDYHITRTHHHIAHYLAWRDFYTNRVSCYKSSQYVKAFVRKLNTIVQRMSDIQDDDIEEFEENILGGIIRGVLEGDFDFRKKELMQFTSEFKNQEIFRIVEAQRGESNPHKIVLIFYGIDVAYRFRTMLNSRHISFYSGYDLENDKFSNLKGCQSVRNKIVELPIENDRSHMDYLYQSVKDFIKTV